MVDPFSPIPPYLDPDAEAEAQLEALDPKTPPEPGVPAPGPVPA